MKGPTGNVVVEAAPKLIVPATSRGAIVEGKLPMSNARLKVLLDPEYGVFTEGVICETGVVE